MNERDLKFQLTFSTPEEIRDKVVKVSEQLQGILYIIEELLDGSEYAMSYEFRDELKRTKTRINYAIKGIEE